MWWFVKSRAEKPDVDPVRQERYRKEKLLLELAPDLSERLLPANVAIKIWLPELVARTIKWMANYEGQSQSEWLRRLLVAYLYGRVALAAQRLREENRDDIRFSRKAVDRTQGRWVYLVPQLGKNTVAFKLWVSEQMRDDLQVLADHAQVGLSPFVRETIISDLLGRASLPERPKMFAEITPDALRWERGEEVPVREVEEFGGLGEAEQVWREEPDA